MIRSGHGTQFGVELSKQGRESVLTFPLFDGFGNVAGKGKRHACDRQAGAEDERMMCHVDDRLARALEPVLRDVARTGVPVPRFQDDDWQPLTDHEAAMMWSDDGSGMGVSIYLGDSEPARIARAAEQVQEWVIEELWTRAPTNWPVCPRHPTTHPLASTELAAAAVWVCPKDRVMVSLVGSL